MEMQNIKRRRIPIVLVGTALMNLGMVVWWASARERDVFFLEQRVTGLEESSQKAIGGQGQMLERLARIEERLNAQTISLDKIEKRIFSEK